jgi:hypothetical protein
MNNAYELNQYAPTYYGGVQIAPGADVGFEPKPYDYIYNPAVNGTTGVLPANAVLANQTVAIQTDADFMLFAWYISQFTGAFQILLTDDTGYQMFSGFLNSGAISQSSSAPTVFSPSHPFRAGGKIVIAITDLSGASNPLQIVFKGEKLFRVNRSPGRRAA